MKTKLRYFLFALALLLPCFGAAANALEDIAQKNKKLPILLTGAENCPYNCKFSKPKSDELAQVPFIDQFHKDDINGYGYVVDIIKAVFEPLGQRVTYRIMPKDRAKGKVERGVYTILLSNDADLKKSDKFIFSTQPIGRISRNFYINIGTNWKFAGLDSLETLKLGLDADENYPELSKYIAKHKASKLQIKFFKPKENVGVHLKKLLKNEFGAVYEDEYSADYYRKLNKIEDDIIYAGKIKDGRNIYLAFSAADPHAGEYVKQFDDGVEALRSSGELEKILNKYGIEDWDSQ